MLQPSVVDAVERHLVGRDADERGDLRAQLLARLEQPHELRDSAATLVEAALLRRAHRLDRPARERPDASGLQVRVALEHRELRASFLEGHARDSADSRV